MSNSMRDVLDKLSAGNGTQGWGAIAAISRSDINQQLQQQYVERYQRLAFVPLFSGEVGANDPMLDTLTLAGVELGAPTLSFQYELSVEVSVVVAMSIVAGRYSSLHHVSGGATTVSASSRVTKSMGFMLTLSVRLSTDDTGRVTFNLAEGYDFGCNLAGLDEANNQRLATLFADRFQQIALHRGVFSVVQVQLARYSAQAVESFQIHPVVAPGADVPGAENFGEGALLLLMRLSGHLEQGQFPPSETLPYPIPDEHGTGNQGKYGTVLILSREAMSDVDTRRLPILDSLRFTSGDTFTALERYWHDDLVVFGTLRATLASVTPLFTTIKAGQTQRFILRDGQGQVIPLTDWSAVSLQSHTTAGHGSISADGLYTAPAPETIGHDLLRVVITATYNDSGVTRTASALLGVVFESMALVPRVAVVAGGAESMHPVSLGASTLDAIPVQWRLSGPQYGELGMDGGVRFVADARSGKKALVAQHIDALGSETGLATVLIANGQQLLRVEPPFVARARRRQAVQLKDDSALLPGLRRRWKVIGGAGTVDPQGLFMPPDVSVVASSVVSCEVVNNGVVLACGYSVIELSEMDEEPSWKELSMFIILVPGGTDNQREGRLYPNGYQQLRLQVKTQTMPVDGIDYPLSVIERASMLLVNEDGNQNLESVSPELDGISEEDTKAWRVSLLRNRFELAGPGLGAEESDLNAPVIVTQNFYLHSREDTAFIGNFYATFQKDDGQWKTSLELEDINSLVQITPRQLPQFDKFNYIFVPTRATGAGGNPLPEPPPAGDPDDPFDFELKTVDYWALSVRYPDTGQWVKFETLEFLAVIDSQRPNEAAKRRRSMILWESEQAAEIMFSWTGYIFDDAAVKDDARMIGFDTQLEKLLNKDTYLTVPVKATEFETGKLVISLHRTYPVVFIPASPPPPPPTPPNPLPEAPARDYLSGSLAVRLLDTQGNVHKRMISFLPQGQVGRRNRLQHTQYSPPDRNETFKQSDDRESYP
ncbi:hypothetical protein [Pseudomonas syringae group genomosp. 3]|uniref:hypothetical protein n=1 Tax=Pseudomonas syringae group genomosp. 3 TaxID=251701 RepID=UPI0006E5735F|nr:hypothetical protein [Pseudomonas syringae group genomosp. 3]KPW47695.1 Uncharacterized protein ALO86_00418 [Pseudomonas syringae pv. berberidis]RMP68878.1 hypothetical protein ALQ19_04189 [Pseudomonas syringae pv. berberidis]